MCNRIIRSAVKREGITLHASPSSLVPTSLNFIITLSQLASRVGEDQLERRRFSAHFVKVDLRIRVYVVIDKLGNVLGAQQLRCALLISSDYVEIFRCDIFTQNCH